MTAAVEMPERREWTVDDLDELPADLPYELINGRLVVPSATPAHQDLSFELVLAVRAACPPEYLVSFDQSLSVDRRNEPRPDIVAVRVEHYSRSPVPVNDAVLAVEVISASSTFRDTVEKAGVYAGAGIATYWMIDQLSDEISLTEMILEPEHGRYALGTHTTGVFSVTKPWPITIDLPALTARRAEILQRAADTDD